MANTDGTGSVGGNPANASAAARGQAAAAAAPSVSEPTDAQVRAAQAEAPVAVPATVEDDAAPRKYGKVFIAEPGGITPDSVEPHPEAEGGVSFDYGQVPAENLAKDEKRAADVGAYDATLRNENPDKIVYRAAGTSGDIGGESFDYGQKPKPESSDTE